MYKLYLLRGAFKLELDYEILIPVLASKLNGL